MWVLLRDVTSRIRNLCSFLEGWGGEWFIKGKGEVVAVNACWRTGCVASYIFRTRSQNCKK